MVCLWAALPNNTNETHAPQLLWESLLITWKGQRHHNLVLVSRTKLFRGGGYPGCTARKSLENKYENIKPGRRHHGMAINAVNTSPVGEIGKSFLHPFQVTESQLWDAIYVLQRDGLIAITNLLLRNMRLLLFRYIGCNKGHVLFISMFCMLIAKCGN